MRLFFTILILACAYIFSLSSLAVGEVYRADDLRVKRWFSAKVKSHKVMQVDRVVARIIANKHRYVVVDNKTQTPWYVIAVLHNMESGGSFRHHLHEGSPLSGRTRWVPKGRPKWGKPPYKWEDSAVDALAYDKMGDKRWAYLFDTLWAIQCYNGTGYWKYHRSTPTPYIYAATTIERRGKYISDGKWSSTAISKQIGAGAIIKRMEATGIINFNRLK
jgi:lysozyme family protein